MVCCPSLYIIAYCGLSPLPCTVITFYYGMSSLNLPYYYLLWCITLALCYYCSLCFVIRHLALLLHHSMPFLGIHLIMLLLVVVCHSSPCVTTSTCLLKPCTSPPFLPCASFGAWSTNFEVSHVVLEK
jgi:hypothetical protein